jgi:hypothetical protein
MGVCHETWRGQRNSVLESPGAQEMGGSIIKNIEKSKKFGARISRGKGDQGPS